MKRIERNIRKKNINDKYPFPNINDLSDKLEKCNYFTTLDLASGVDQIEIDEKKIEETTVLCKEGNNEFLRTV